MMRLTPAALSVLPLLLSGSAATSLNDHSPTKHTYQNILTNGSVTAEYTSTNTSSFDGPKLGEPGPANISSYDWWYFDAVSASTDSSVTVVFYNCGPQGFINRYVGGGPFSVGISGRFANGTTFDMTVPSTGVVIDYGPDKGIDFDMVDSGFSFTGSNVEGPKVHYVVTIDSPSIGIKGTIELFSRAPAHYPCGPNIAGATQQVMPHVGWAITVPDAHAIVALEFTSGAANDTTTAALAFTDGVGYHDKNWGDQPFLASTETWYWGHARMGPYSLVWFDAFDLAGAEYSSGYVVADGAVVASSCASGAVQARPWGLHSEFPPNVTTGVPEGYGLVFDLGDGEFLRANVTQSALAFGPPPFGYSRSIGHVVGGLDGEEVYEGRALFEQFTLIGFRELYGL